MKSRFKSIIKSMWDFFVPLISEKNDSGEFKRASLGRIAFWIAFLLAVWVWITSTGDIQSAHTQLLYTLLAYNLMKKTGWFSVKNDSTGVQIENKPDKPRES